MKNNSLSILINRSVKKVFAFTTTPPNSTLWIPSVVKEETNEWPIKAGTVYKLQDEGGVDSEVTVSNLKINEYIEWTSNDHNYHCRYTFKQVGSNASVLDYYEWVDKGEIKNPFTLEILKKLKSVIEE